MSSTQFAFLVPALLVVTYRVLVFVDTRRRPPDLRDDEYRTSYRNGQR